MWPRQRERELALWEMGGEVSCRKARSLDPGFKGIMEEEGQALRGGEGKLQSEPVSRQRAFKSSGWKGCLRFSNMNQHLARSPHPWLGP